MINWQTWEALTFKKAQAENKPICLIVTHDGYWSRVMMRRALRHPLFTSLLNEAYVAIQANAEEYPEVSSFALKFLKVSTGRAGWPLVLWLTPTGEPIMGLNSLTLEDEAPQKFGLITHLKIIAEHWRDPAWSDINRPALERIQSLSDFSSMRHAGQLSPDEYMIDYAERWILRVDPIWGGFSSPLKFPLPLVLSGLLGVWNELGHPQHLQVAEYSLGQMLSGGVFDHVGGGIWRYSLDEQWSSGCHEKLLIDQAHFILLLSSLYRVTQRRVYRDALAVTAQLLIEEFASSEGGFIGRIGLEDHDVSKLDRGAFHQASWSHEEVLEALEPIDAEWFMNSFLSPIHTSQRELGHNGQRYLPRLAYPLSDEEARYWKKLRPILFNIRKKRDSLDRSSWRVCVDNAVASVALAQAALILDEPMWFKASQNTLDWLIEELWDGRRLFRAFHGKKRVLSEGCLEDYMSMTWALSELSLYTGDQHKAQLSEVIFDTAFDLFKDMEGKGFFHASPRRRKLLAIKEKPTLDGVDLSGNAWAVFALKRLSELTNSSFHHNEFLELAESFAGSVSCQMSCAVSTVASLLKRSSISKEL